MAFRIFLFFFATINCILHSQDAHIDRRFVIAPQTASTTGNAALFHNPAGLAFMGGTEASLLYLYEWSDLGNRHHGGANLAVNFGKVLTLAGGLNTKAAFSTKAQNQLGTDLLGIMGGAISFSPYVSFGIATLKSHNFLTRMSSPWLVSFGLQARPWSFLALGGHYEEVHPGIFSAPNLTAGISIRPYKEFLTVGLDGKWVSLSERWNGGFRFDPIFSLKGDFGGYGIAVSAEIPGLRDGWTKPIFNFSIEFNFAHFGVGIGSVVNPAARNYGVGTTLRASTDEWTSVVQSKNLWVEFTIDSDGSLYEKPKSFAERLFVDEPSPLAVLALLRRIEADKSVSGVVLNFRGFRFGDARAQEWRNMIKRLRQAQKEVIIYLDAPSERDYFIATAANKILMNKQATLSLKNFQATLIYLKDLLDKIGVQADAVVAGSYKNAPRQWTHSRPQKEEIEIANNILNSFYDALLRETASSRNIDRNVLQTLFDRGEITAELAKSSGLVDEMVAPRELTDSITNQGSRQVSFKAHYEKRSFKQTSWHPNKSIVVIPIEYAIVDGHIFPGLFSDFFPVTGAEDVVDEIEDAVSDDNVVGIVVRINSPGGDAVAGHKIQHAIMNAKNAKPVVTSMSDVAASAGYLIASGSSHILAEPNTITGSIGVFSLMFSAEKLADKIGVFSKELAPIKNPGPTVLRSITDEERKEAQKIVDWYYENFIQAVSDGLKIDKSEVLKNADGRVWLGEEALAKKLVHELGGFSESIDTVRMIAEVPPEDEITVDVRTPGASEQFFLPAKILSLFRTPSMAKEIKPVLSFSKPYLKLLEAYRLNAQPQARMPFDIEWKNRNTH